MHINAFSLLNIPGIVQTIMCLSLHLFVFITFQYVCIMHLCFILILINFISIINYHGYFHIYSIYSILLYYFSLILFLICVSNNIPVTQYSYYLASFSLIYFILNLYYHCCCDYVRLYFGVVIYFVYLKLLDFTYSDNKSFQFQHQVPR